MALTTAAVPLWMRLSLLQERGSRPQQALGALEAGGARDLREEMRLQAALGASTAEASEMGAAFTKVLDIAESLGDSEYQLRALHGLYFYNSGGGRYRAALQCGQKFHDLAMSGADPSDRLFAERIMGAVKHFCGDQNGARRHLEQVLVHFAASDQRWDVIRFQTDLQVAARAFLARVLWLQGFSDQTVRTAEMSIAEVQATGHTMSLCLALGMAACQIALWVGNLAAASRYTGMLLDHSRQHGMPFWNDFVASFQRQIVLRGGDVDIGSWPLDTVPDETVQPNAGFRFLTGLTELADALTHAGRITEALALVEAGIEHSERGWLTPELLRFKGELFLLLRTSAVTETAEDFFRQALDASRPEMLAWELRAATSLARLLHQQGRCADAIACLHPVYKRFTEGFGTADLIATKQLLDDLGVAEYR